MYKITNHKGAVDKKDPIIKIKPIPTKTKNNIFKNDLIIKLTNLYRSSYMLFN